MSVTCGQCDSRPSYLPGHKASPPIVWYQIILLGGTGMCVNMPRVEFDSEETRIRNCDLFITSVSVCEVMDEFGQSFVLDSTRDLLQCSDAVG